ncbi:MAG: VWA domain-containing protein [Prevotellaceae bacterium]|jgi:Mg-chelatase subunit ChlD|nr:VWA domain-containing protein [Prevotellaceae bacterium]MDY3855866.1 vWA domain-containing protein [Bacteroidaceae bacterium]
MKRVFNLIIVDESGSMCVIEKQALLGLNETLETVKKMQKLHKDMEQRVTLITFDSDHKRYVFDNAPASQTHKLSTKEYRPGGATPLYDAIGLGISKLNAQTGDDDDVLVTIITDGEENCSEEYNLEMIKTLIEKLKKHNWTFTLIGTDNLDVEGMAGSMAIDNHLEFKEDEEGTKRMFARERRSRARYNACVANKEQRPMGCYFKEDDMIP